MGISDKYDVTGPGISQFRHKLMADAVAGMDFTGTEFFGKLISVFQVIPIEGKAGRKQMVEHNDDFFRIPGFSKSHFLELPVYICRIDIVKHDAVRMSDDDVTGSAVCYACIMHQNFFC